MRRLHPVGVQEQFIASGEYHTIQSFQQWTIHSVGEGYLVRSETRLVNGYNIDEVLLSDTYDLVRLNREEYIGNLRQQKLSVFVDEKHISTMQWTQEASETLQVERYYENWHVFYQSKWFDYPMPYVMCGFMVLDMANLAKFTTIGLGEDAVQVLGQDTLTLTHKTITVTGYTIRGWQYWLDEHHLPIKIVTPEQQEIRVSNYAHR
jgi:hypothetical protein